MTTIKPETIDMISESLVIMASFVKCGTHATAETKISLAYHTASHCYTVEAWAKIPHRRFMTLRGWGSLVDTIKPHTHTLQRTDKGTGVDTDHPSKDYAKSVFSAVCDELAKRTTGEDVYLDQYQTFKRK